MSNCSYILNVFIGLLYANYTLTYLIMANKKIMQHGNGYNKRIKIVDAKLVSNYLSNGFANGYAVFTFIARVKG